MRYINHRKLSVGLPLAFSVMDYYNSPDIDQCLHWKLSDSPNIDRDLHWKLSDAPNIDQNWKFSLNEMHLTLHDNHLLKIYYNNNQDFFQFTYLIDDIIIHQYTDNITYKDDSIIELGRIVDNKYAFYCWKIKKSIFYQRLK